MLISLVFFIQIVTSVFSETYLTTPNQSIKHALTGNPQNNQVSIPFAFTSIDTTNSTKRHLRALIVRDENNDEIAYGTTTTFVSRNISRFQNRLSVSRSGNQYVLSIRDLKISDDAQFTAHALYEEISEVNEETKHYVDKTVVELIIQGPPRHCNDIESDTLLYNATRLNRFHTYICANPRPNVTIKHQNQDIAIREIIEDPIEKHRYRYTFDLVDLTTSDCGSEVVATVIGDDDGASKVLTRTLKLDALPTVQDVVAKRQGECIKVTFTVFADLQRCSSADDAKFSYKVNYFDADEKIVSIDERTILESDGFQQYCATNATEIENIKKVNVIFHREITLNNVTVETQNLQNALHHVIEVVSTSNKFDERAKHLRVLTRHSGHYQDAMEILFRVAFPVDGKTRSVTSLVVQFDEQDVDPARQLASGTRDDFNIINSVPKKERYTATFVAEGESTIYNLTISPVLYKDDMVKLEAVLLFEEDGTFVTERAHTVLLVRGGPVFCDETNLEELYNVSIAAGGTPVTQSFNFAVCGNPKPKVTAFWGEKRLQLTETTTNQFSTNFSLSITGIEPKDCGKKLSLIMEGYEGILKKESILSVNFTPKLSATKSRQFGSCIVTKWDSIDTGFCPQVKYTVRSIQANGQAHFGTSNTTLNHNMVCFPSSAQAFVYMETRIRATFTSSYGDLLSTEQVVAIEKEPIIVPEPPKLVEEDTAQSFIKTSSTIDVPLSSTASINIKISNQILQDDLMSVAINRNGLLAIGNKDFNLGNIPQNTIFHDRLTAAYSETDFQYKLEISSVAYNLSGDFVASLFYQMNGKFLVEKKKIAMIVKGGPDRCGPAVPSRFLVQENDDVMISMQLCGIQRPSLRLLFNEVQVPVFKVTTKPKPFDYQHVYHVKVPNLRAVDCGKRLKYTANGFSADSLNGEFTVNVNFNKTTKYSYGKDCDGCISTNWRPVESGDCGTVKYKLQYKGNTNSSEIKEGTSAKICGEKAKGINKVRFSTVFENVEYEHAIQPMAVPGCAVVDGDSDTVMIAAIAGGAGGGVLIILIIIIVCCCCCRKSKDEKNIEMAAMTDKPSPAKKQPMDNEEEFVVVNPNQYIFVDPSINNNSVSQPANERPPSTLLDNAMQRQDTMNIGYPKGEFDSCSEDEADAPPPPSNAPDNNIQRQDTMIGYPKGEFDSCSEDEIDVLPPPIDPTPTGRVEQESHQQQNNSDFPDYQQQNNPEFPDDQQQTNPNLQRQGTVNNNIGYPKGEFDSDTDDEQILNDYENYDPKSGTLKAQ